MSEEGTQANGIWRIAARLNGAEDNEGRTFFLWAHNFRLRRARLHKLPK
jgi:hypothetical protein